MKTINEILNNYKEYKTFLADRFGVRFCDFLTPSQCEQIGFKLKEEYIEEHNKNIKEWTFENVIKHLKEDAAFGLEKARNERGITSLLMYEVCLSWCKIIDKEDLIFEYDNYGYETFYNILKYINEIEKEKL